MLGEVPGHPGFYDMSVVNLTNELRQSIADLQKQVNDLRDENDELQRRIDELTYRVDGIQELT